MTRFILHVRASRKLSFFFAEEGGSGANRTRAFSVKEKYLMLYSIQSQRLYRFRHRGCWDRRSFGPYFRFQLAILQCSKRQGPCLLHMSNAHTPYSSDLYGDVLHEGITDDADKGRCHPTLRWTVITWLHPVEYVYGNRPEGSRVPAGESTWTYRFDVTRYCMMHLLTKST